GRRRRGGGPLKRFAAAWRAAIEARDAAAEEAVLVAWLRAAPPHDAACGVWFLAGKRERGITSAELQRWAIAASGGPEWLFETARAATGSLPETAALLLGGDRPASDWPLARLVRERLAAL